MQKILRYLQTTIPAGKKEQFPGNLGLKRMKEFLRRIGNPHQSFPSIHIAGTSGKGSTALFTARILQAANLKVGLHTSPHLQTVRERMAINDLYISEQSFVNLIEDLRPTIESMRTEYKLGSPSYFEILVAASFAYFAKQNVDVAVIEAGLGGRYDGTAALAPVVSVLTNVGLDHTNILGKTKSTILKDKMQIIKPCNRVAISGVMQPYLRAILEQHCQKQSVPLLQYEDAFYHTIQKTSPHQLVFDYHYQKNAIKNIKKRLSNRKNGGKQVNSAEIISNIVLATGATYQATNASLAITACRQFALTKNISLTNQHIKDGLKTARFPGRFEHRYVRDLNTKSSKNSVSPLIILDGAHNNDKLRALVASLKKVYPKQKWIVVFALKQNKDAQALLRIISPITHEFIITEFSSATDMGLNLFYPAQKLHNLAKQVLEIPVYLEKNSKTALLLALKKLTNSTNKTGVLVTGSLYLVGEVRDAVILDL